MAGCEGDGGDLAGSDWLVGLDPVEELDRLDALSWESCVIGVGCGAPGLMEVNGAVGAAEWVEVGAGHGLVLLG